ncbi:MAG: aldo/keto reductase [Planctomycetota bacterium]|jgi:aryl-alcohol dehydrogenase-like predicted oxidoreductase
MGTNQSIAPRPLGRTGCKVSPLCLGTMNFGQWATEDEGHAIMDSALERGINFFDTADVYGGERGAGLTEQIIGRWFAQGGERRERVVLATKVFGPMDTADRPDANRGRGLSKRKIIQACEASLRRLQTDWIDLYQMHHIDRSCPWDEVWEAMETLVAQGKVLYVGSSNFAGWDIAAANETAKSRNFLGLVSEQSLYNLMERTIELEVLPACRHYGVAVIPWSPLHRGLLAGVLGDRGGETDGDGRKQRRGQERNKERIEAIRPQLERWEGLCAELGHPPAVVALAWLLRQPGVTSPIIGPRTMAQLDSALAALECELSDETCATLDEIWPGPGGPAPEAYAW